MKLIETKSFKLAVITRGNKNSEMLAVLMPGRMDTKDYVNFITHANYLAAKKFFVIVFDPPYTWESPGNTELFSTSNYIKATNELIEYFGNKPTLLLGHSRGAATAVFVAKVNPAVIGVITVMANFRIPTSPSDEDIKKGFREEIRDIPPGSSKTKIKKSFKLSLDYWEDGKQYNAGETLKFLVIPKLIVYGTRDEFSLPSEVKEIYKNIPEPKMIKEIDSTHDYRYYPKAIEEVNETIEKFLGAYINTRAMTEKVRAKQ